MRIGERIQGTDGIRGKTALSDDPSVKGKSPLQAFLERGILTDSFFDLYSYCHVSLSIERGFVRPGEEIVVGWDPRDPSGVFRSAAVRGIRKAGGNALMAGVLPTPAIPIVMLARKAAGAVSITASHNPPDQNGIKIFLRDSALKPLPPDDERLTAKLFATDYEKVRSLPLKGEERDGSREARETFIRFCLDPRNGWTGDGGEFSKIHLIVDCANGSYSDLAGEVFRRSGFGAVEEWNTSQNGDVNRDCGVADLEGVRGISEAMVLHPEGKFFRHGAVRRLWELGRANRERAIAGEIRVAGAFFDADGDRFYRADYNPIADEIHILSGDETAYLQGKFLSREPSGVPGRPLYVNTVESDLNAFISAGALGFTPVTVPVGDKWLLLHAHLTHLLTSLDRCMESAPGDKREELKKIRSEAETWISSPRADSEEITLLTRRFREIKSKWFTEEEKYEPRSGFGIGSEESGHTVTTGFLQVSPGRTEICFVGNGLKSALNTFASVERLCSGKTPGEYYDLLAAPFPSGFKRTLYVFYIDKGLFRSGSPVFREVEEEAASALRERFPSTMGLKRVILPQDPELMYLGIEDREGRRVAVLFVRNSGTEDKIGVTLRSQSGWAEPLADAGEIVRRKLIETMKDRSKPEWRAEAACLRAIADGTAGNLPETAGIGLDRLLKEMGPKQGLIHGAPPNLKLTELGKWYHRILTTPS